jgi:hypothetical protein
LGPVAVLWGAGEIACARRSDGSVVCWGGGIRDNRLCGTVDGSYVCVPREIRLFDDATDLAIASLHVCAVVGGRVACAGWD